MTEVTATEFRKQLFSLLDRAIDGDDTIVIRRRGRRFVLRAEPEPAPPEHDHWARYDAWIAARRARGEIPVLTDAEADAYEAEQDRLDAEIKAEIRAETEAEWDELYAAEKSAA